MLSFFLSRHTFPLHPNFREADWKPRRKGSCQEAAVQTARRAEPRRLPALPCLTCHHQELESQAALQASNMDATAPPPPAPAPAGGSIPLPMELRAFKSQVDVSAGEARHRGSHGIPMHLVEAKPGHALNAVPHYVHLTHALTRLVYMCTDVRHGAAQTVCGRLH